MFGWIKNIFSKKPNEQELARIDYDRRVSKVSADYMSGSMSTYDVVSFFSGEKFAGGWGLDNNYESFDLVKLQERSRDLFRSNSFAGSLLGRLRTSVVNAGLWVESKPIFKPLEKYINMTEDELEEWAENVEVLHGLWADQKELVDYKKESTFDQIQKNVYNTANVSGDVLIILHISKSQLPVIQTIDGINVQTPFNFIAGKNERGNRVVNGVELDKDGKHLGYYVTTGNYNEFKYIAAIGKNTKRRVAWLYGNGKKMVNDVRCMPILGTILQNLKEIDKYMDSEQRAALLNSMIALKHTAAPGSGLDSSFLGQGAQRRVNVDVSLDDNTTNSVQFEQYGPGMILTNLKDGEKVESFDNNRPNTNFGKYIETALKQLSHSMGIPPEIFFLEFNNNYSASRQATIEFNSLIKEERSLLADDFLKVVYQEWFIGMVLSNLIDAPFFIEFYMNYDQRWIEFSSYLNCDFRGLVKENVDMLKQVKALALADEKGYMTGEQITNEYFNNSFRQNMRRKKKENTMIAEARQPLVDQERELKEPYDEDDEDDEDDIEENSPEKSESAA